MVAPGIPSMVWGGQVRMIARALGVELDELRETVDRRPLEADVTNALGDFAAGSQGALRFEVQGIVAGEPRIVVEHVTRITGACAPDWPTAARRRRRRAPRDHRGPAPDRGGRSRPPTRAATGPPAATRPPPTASSTPSRGCAPPSPGCTTGCRCPSPPPPDACPPPPRGTRRDHRRTRGQGPDRLRVGGDGGRDRPGRGDVRDQRLLRQHARPARVRGGPAPGGPDQRLPVLPGLAHRARRREGRGHASTRRSPSGARPTPSTTAPGSRRSTPSATASTTTASTTSSGAG